MKVADFEENGYTILKNVYSKEKLQAIYQRIMLDIRRCADELDCSLETYLTNVSRWLNPSPVTASFCTLVETTLKDIVQNFMREEVKLFKSNVISKTIYAKNPVPCHQDIAYSREAPYEFSLWLPLEDVSLSEGPLEFLPKSHLEKIEPAVDFWQPNFIDKMHSSTRWQRGFVSSPIQAGDAIIFDSRIWHGSPSNLSGRSRFAIVTRWSRISYCPPHEIPEKTPAKFGMWTAGSVTESILKQGLLACFQLNVTSNLETCLQLWQEKLDGELPFQINVVQVKKALQSLWILHRAAQLHNGGDAQGVVYPNLWHHFLNPLAQWLNYSQNHIRKTAYEQSI